MRLGAEEVGHERDYEGLRDRRSVFELKRGSAVPGFPGPQSHP